MYLLIICSDYSNVEKMIILLRKILLTYAERDKNVSFTCEWCESNRKSVVGYVNLVIYRYINLSNLILNLYI